MARGGFRRAIFRWGSESTGVLTGRYWGFFVAAFVVASGLAGGVYKRLDLPQRYSELVVGNIAWNYDNKFHDYAVLYAVVFLFLVLLLAIAGLAARIRRVGGTGEVDRFHDLLLVLCAPAVLWLSALPTTRDASLDLLTASRALLVVGLGSAAVLASKRESFWRDAPHLLADVLQRVVLFAVFAGLAVAAVAVAQNRLGGMFHSHAGMTSDATWRWTKIVLLCASLIGAGLIVTAREPHRLRHSLARSAMCAQLFMPLFLLCLMPPAWVAAPDATLVAGYALSTFGKWTVFGALGLAFAESAWKFARTSATADRSNASALRLLTVGSALGLLLFFKTPVLGVPALAADDYHFGELLVPWWSWHEMGMLPFWDYAPARGLINYFPGFVSSTFFDGGAASIGASYAFVFAGVGLTALLALRPLMGVAGAFVALLLGPYANGIGEIDIAVTLFLVFFCHGWLHWRSERWLVAFAAAGVALLLYAPGQSALALIALTPLALGRLRTICIADRRRSAYVLAGVVGVLGVLFFLTPLGRMFFGALRYGAEQSQLNSIAHGIAWRASFASDALNPWFFEIVRASFVLVALWAGVLLSKAFFSPDATVRRKLLAYALPVFIVSLLFVVRAAGRIDTGGSRLGIASVWALALLLPVLMFASTRVRGVHLLLWVGLAGMLIPYIGNASSAGYVSRLRGNFDPPDATMLDTARNTRTVDAARLGSSVGDPAHLARIVEVRQVLDRVLDATETYLDLSGRHALYYYVDRKPALESASMYNLVGEKQQLRAIGTIRAANFPAILLSADNIVQDGGPSSLRSNLVYREVLLSKGYKLATIGKQVWMLRDDRVARLAPEDAASLTDMRSVQALGVLDPIYHQPDLMSVPASWGRSAPMLERTLSAPMLQVAPDSSVAHASLHSVQRQGSGSYTVTGPDPYIRFDISGSGPSGRQAGILSFDFACESPRAAPALGLYWATPDSPESRTNFFRFHGHQGRLIVPVDSAPSWLLAERIDSLRLGIDGDNDGCETFSIGNLELRARKAAPQ
ncbi:MAG: hypothetical protein ACRYGA_16655 [Janthinobacterium lividum]